jgi:O-antigen ligase
VPLSNTYPEPRNFIGADLSPRRTLVRAAYLINKVRRTTLDSVAYVAIWCFVFSVPWEKTLIIPGLGSISRLLGVLVLPVGLLALAARGWLRQLSVTHWCMLAFALWATLSYFWTVSTEATIDRAFTEIQLVIIVILMWQFCTSNAAGERLVGAYVSGTLIVCAATMYRFALHENTYYQRYAAEGFDPNDLSLALTLSIPLSYYLLLRRRGWRIIWIAQIVAVLLSCLLTASRMGAVTTALALSIVIVTADRLRRNERLLLVTTVVAAAIVCTTLIPEASWSRLASILTEMQYGTLNHRTAIWSAAVDEFGKRPIVGVGAGAFGLAVDPLEAYSAHNTFISVLIELGTVGLVLFLMIVGSLAAGVFRMKSLARKTWFVTLAVWAVGASTLTWEHRKPTWMIFALILQTSRQVSSRHQGDRI